MVQKTDTGRVISGMDLAAQLVQHVHLRNLRSEEGLNVVVNRRFDASLRVQLLRPRA